MHNSAITALFLTPEKINDIHLELSIIENRLLPEIRQRLSTAYADGDLPENNPWETANNDLQEALHRRNYLLGLLAQNKVYQKEHKKSERKLGNEFLISINGQAENKILLVSSEEADPSTGKLSIDSPIGKAILLAKEGVTSVEVKTPTGYITVTYKKL